MNLRHRLAFFLIVVILFFFGCQDSIEVDKPKVVRQKIANESSSDAQTQELASGTVSTSSEEKAKLPAEGKEGTSDPSSIMLASKGAAGKYHYQSSLDPFAPLIQEEKNQSAPSTPPVENTQQKKRLPQTPLEKIDLSQLTLTAVFRDNKRSMAMVEESTGKGYMVKKGTYVGLDGGKITKITKDRVFITEVSQDVMGKAVTVERELKLRQFSGE